jgi:hypothetical protein
MNAVSADLDYPVRILLITALIIDVHMDVISFVERRF